MYSTEVTDIDLQLTKYVYQHSDLYILLKLRYELDRLWFFYLSTNQRPCFQDYSNYTKLFMYPYKTLIKYYLGPRAHKVVFERFHSELFQKAPNLLTLFTANEH